MKKTERPSASRFSSLYPTPPRLHWAILLVLVTGLEALAAVYVPRPFRDFIQTLIFAVWPVYLSLWIRKSNHRSLSLYWALASFATGFLFSWILWIVVIYEIREDLLEHYNRNEPIGLRLNWFLSLVLSVVYFQYHLRRIALEKEHLASTSYSSVESAGALSTLDAP
ncbi:MAG: hypothetical protein KGN79_12165 [Acidobacteriota bacterium]|nr:hypothetical protein [Acidobacteriota bacterium]